LWISIFQAIDELVCFKKSKFAVLDLGFEMLGLGLDNRGRTTKNAYRRIYSPWSRQAVRQIGNTRHFHFLTQLLLKQKK
jgi:hypothetical protein